MSIQNGEKTVYDLKKMKDEDKFIIPDYQRNDVWNVTKKKRFINSLIKEHVTAVYFKERDDGKYEIVDGLQRLWYTLFKFMDDEFELSGATDKRLSGCTYSDLREQYPKDFAEFNNKKIAIFIYPKEITDDEIRSRFVDINCSGVQVSYGERIHAFNEDIKRLYNNLFQHPVFKRITHFKSNRYIEFSNLSKLLLFIADSDAENNMIKGTNLCESFIDEIEYYDVNGIDEEIVKKLLDILDFINECLVIGNFKMSFLEFYYTFIYVYVYGKGLNPNVFQHFIKMFWKTVRDAPNNPILKETVFFKFRKERNNNTSSDSQKEFLWNLRRVHKAINGGIGWYAISDKVAGWDIAEDICGLL